MEKAYLANLFIIMLLIAGCGGGGGSGISVPASATEKFSWNKTGDVAGTTGKYTPFVITGPDSIRVYGNYNGSVDGTFFMREGSFTHGVGAASVAILPSQLSDMPGGYIRTTAVAKGATRYYALLHVGNSYENNATGFVPAWATSEDTVNWQYHGRIKIEGAIHGVTASGAALIVQEDKPAVLDTANPANNRFLIWEDGYGADGVSKKLVLIYSADGVDWRFYRGADKGVVDVWPNDPRLAADLPLFPTAAKTPFGYHLIVADGWPSKHHRHLWSCDGLSWRVLEAEAPTFTDYDRNSKGTNLAYDAGTGTLHALSLIHDQMRGSSHWVIAAQAFPCH